jgi:hypothetical protein
MTSVKLYYPGYLGMGILLSTQIKLLKRHVISVLSKKFWTLFNSDSLGVLNKAIT